MIDYKLLLKRYMAKVIDYEGVDCIDRISYDAIEFTQQERNDLKAISNECSELNLKIPAPTARRHRA